MTKAKTKPAAPPIDRLKEVALECHEKAGGIPSNERKLFLDALKADPELQWQAFEPWHDRAAQMWINFATGQHVAPPVKLVETKARGAAGMAAASKLAAQTILDMFTINGQPIGDVTAGEADAWAQSRERDCRWIRSLINGMSPKSIIRDCVSAKEAQRLYDAAKAEVA